MAVSPTQPMSRPRVLLVAEVADPEGASVPLVGWSHARTLARVADAHLVTQVRSRAAIVRAGLREGEEFTTIDSERLARPAWKFVEFVRGGSDKGWTTATARRRGHELVLRAPGLEALRRADPRARVRRGASPDAAQPDHAEPPRPALRASRRAVRPRPAQRRRSLAQGLRFRAPSRAGVAQLRARCVSLRARLSRDAEPAPPQSWSGRATRSRRWASTWRSKCVYIPENGYDPARFPDTTERSEAPPLRVVFVGRLVPYKGADMLLDAAAPLIREGRVRSTSSATGRRCRRCASWRREKGSATAWSSRAGSPIASSPAHRPGARPRVAERARVRRRGGARGDGPRRRAARRRLRRPGRARHVAHRSEGLHRNSGGDRRRGARAPDAARRGCAGLVAKLADAARCRAAAHFTWDAKARQVLEVYRWVMGQRPDKPDFGVPFADPEPLANPSHPAECRLPGDLEDVVG